MTSQDVLRHVQHFLPPRLRVCRGGRGRNGAPHGLPRPRPLDALLHVGKADQVVEDRAPDLLQVRARRVPAHRPDQGLDPPLRVCVRE